MIKKTTLSVCLSAILTISLTQISLAKENIFYFRVDAGLNFTNKEDALLINSAGNTPSQMNFNTNSSFGLGLGYEINPHLRADVIGHYRRISSEEENTTNKTLLAADIDNATIMSNIYFHPIKSTRKKSRINPYIVAGIGFAFNNSSNIAVSGLTEGTILGNRDTSLAWKIGSGLSLPLSESFNVDLEYNYIDLGEVETGITASIPGGDLTSSTRISLTAHEVTLGLKYYFPPY